MTIKNFTTDTWFGYGSILMISLLMVGIFLCPKAVAASDITAEKIIELTNRERSERDLNELTAERSLEKAARKKAEFLLEKQIFEHDTPDREFSYWVKDAGYEYSYAGENLAMDFTENEKVVKAWLNSPTHKKNLLYPEYQEIGVAVVEGDYRGQESVLVVQIFGTPNKEEEQRAVAGNDSQATGSPKTTLAGKTNNPENPSFFGALKDKIRHGSAILLEREVFYPTGISFLVIAYIIVFAVYKPRIEKKTIVMKAKKVVYFVFPRV